MDALAEIKQTFFQECEAQLVELEAGLLDIEHRLGLGEDPRRIRAPAARIQKPFAFGEHHGEPELPVDAVGRLAVAR